jgi:hypothetical protein
MGHAFSCWRDKGQEIGWSHPGWYGQDTQGDRVRFGDDLTALDARFIAKDVYDPLW